MSDQPDLKGDFAELHQSRRDQLARKPSKPLQPPSDESSSQRVVRLIVQAVVGMAFGALPYGLSILVPSSTTSMIALCVLPFLPALGVTLVGRYFYRQPGSYAQALYGAIIAIALVSFVIGMIIAFSGWNEDLFFAALDSWVKTHRASAFYIIVPPILSSLSYDSRWKPLYQRKKKADEQPN